MNTRELANNIYYVGAIDFRVRNFHGYSTEKGSSYNAFLIVDDDITLIDTVKEPFYKDYLDSIQSVVDFKDIKNIIINHSEPDHSGALPYLLKVAVNAKVYADKMGAAFIKKHYGSDIDVNIISAGQELCIGKRVLQFAEAPMVHWPDNMVTYIKDEGILFSNDIFGQHIACFERLDNEYPQDIIIRQARKYYANIVLPYSNNASKAFSALKNMDLKLILPSHGLGFRDNIRLILDEYETMIAGKKQHKAVVIYDTMWTSTEKMAKAIAKGFLDAGVNVTVMDTQNNHISDIITEVMDAEYVAVGSPTLNNGVLPTIASMLCYMKGLLPPSNGKKFIAFGSYGWGGQSIGIIENELSAMKMTPAADKIRVQFVPDEATLIDIENKVKEAVSQ